MAAINDSSAASPVAYLLFPDPAWTGSAAVVSATSENGATQGPVAASSTNRGYAYPYQEGDPSTSTDLTLRAQGGGPGRAGGWLYRLDTETTSADWKGMNALTILQRSKPVTTADPLYAHGLVYSNLYGRLVVAYLYSATQVKISYASAGNTLGAWSTTTLSVSDAYTTTPQGGLAMCEIPDGNLLLALQVTRNGFVDCDLYESSDGGVVWSRCLVGIGLHDADGNGYGGQDGQLKLVASGDYVRVFAVASVTTASTTAVLSSMVSADRGATWEGGGSTTLLTWPALTAGFVGSAPFDAVGVGDIAGTILLASLSVLSTTTIQIRYAAGLDNMTHLSDLDIDMSGYASSPKVKALWWCSIPDYLLLYVWVEGSDYSDVAVFRVAKNDPTDPANWKAISTITGFQGASYYLPHRPHAVWAGSRGFVSAGMMDPTTAGGGDPVVAGHWTMEFGAWDPKPLNPNTAGSTFYFSSTNQLVHYQWMACMGLPDLDALTPYTHSTFSSVSTTWNRDSVDLTTTSSTGYNRYLLSLSPATNAYTWGYSGNRGFVFRFRLKVTAERDNTVEDVGFRIMAPTTQAVLTTGYDVTVRTFGTKIVVYDNIAGSALATLTTTDCASELEIEAVIAGNQLWLARRLASAAPLGQWTESGPYTMTSGSILGQRLRVGVIAAAGTAGTSTIRLYEWFISKLNDLGQRGDVVKPTDLAGALMTTEPMLVAGGMSVGWSGLGSRDGDTWTAGLTYQRGVVNFSLPSPRHYWEGTSLVEQDIVFQADALGASGGRWQMNGIALIGTTDLGAMVQFSDTNSWGSPAVTWSLSAALFATLKVAAVVGASVQITPASGTYLPWPGQLVGQFIRFTSGSASGKTYRILADQNNDGSWLTVEDGVDLVSAGVAANDDVTIFTDRMVYLDDTFRKYRYFRVVLPDVSGVSGSRGTATGSHRIGAVVPGWSLKLDRNLGVLGQSFTDDESNAYTAAESRSGVRHRVQEGPSARELNLNLNHAASEADPAGERGEVRRSIRDSLREGCAGSTQPVVLVLDSQWRGRENVVYGTLNLTQGTKLDETVAYKATDARWHWSGDLKLTLTEDV